MILGNGFGLSYDRAFGEESFSWSNLLDLCDIEPGSPLYGLLKECNLDFELVHQKLNNALSVLQEYGLQNEMVELLHGQIALLREQLVRAVSKSHPRSFADIGSGSADKVRRCRRFLEQFECVFTLNYDLLLYWVRCHESPILGNDSFCTSNDSGKLIFSETDKSTYFFPHGALFIYRDGISATKLRSTPSVPILATVEQNISEGYFPLCVTEGTGEQKREAIKQNRYLQYCYDRMKSIKGVAFTYGCSFADGKDDHIIEALLRSPVDRIVVGNHQPTRESVLRLLHAFEQVQLRQGARRRVKVNIADTSDYAVW